MRLLVTQRKWLILVCKAEVVGGDSRRPADVSTNEPVAPLRITPTLLYATHQGVRRYYERGPTVLFYALIASLITRLRRGESVRWVVVGLLALTGFSVAVYAWIYFASPSSPSDVAATRVNSAAISGVKATPYVAPTMTTAADEKTVQNYCNDRSLHPATSTLSAEGCICTFRTLAAKLGYSEARRRWNELATSAQDSPVIDNLLRDVPLLAQC